MCGTTRAPARAQARARARPPRRAPARDVTHMPHNRITTPFYAAQTRAHDPAHPARARVPIPSIPFEKNGSWILTKRAAHLGLACSRSLIGFECRSVTQGREGKSQVPSTPVGRHNMSRRWTGGQLHPADARAAWTQSLLAGRGRPEARTRGRQIFCAEIFAIANFAREYHNHNGAGQLPHPPFCSLGNGTTNLRRGGLRSQQCPNRSTTCGKLSRGMLINVPSRYGSGFRMDWLASCARTATLTWPHVSVCLESP